MNRAKNIAAALFVITLSACHATTPATPKAQTAGKDDKAGKADGKKETPGTGANNLNQDLSKAHNLTEKGKGIATDSTDLQENFRITARSGDSLTFALKGAEAKRLYDALQLSEEKTMIDKIEGTRKTGPAVNCTKCDCDPAKKPELDYACTFVLDSKNGKFLADASATPASTSKATATAIVPNVSGTNPSPKFKIPFMDSEATSGPANIEYYILGIYTVPSNKAEIFIPFGDISSEAFNNATVTAAVNNKPSNPRFTKVETKTTADFIVDKRTLKSTQEFSTFSFNLDLNTGAIFKAASTSPRADQVKDEVKANEKEPAKKEGAKAEDAKAEDASGMNADQQEATELN